MEDTLREALSEVRLVVLDVDGVLTDGRLLYTETGDGVSFDVQDGQALRWLQESNITVAWVTGRGGPAVARRARELDIREFRPRTSDKAAALREMQTRLDLPLEATLAMGDDLPDLALARNARLFAAPSNARTDVRERADIVTSASGGRGAVRELAEMILRASGKWDVVLGRYLG